MGTPRFRFRSANVLVVGLVLVVLTCLLACGSAAPPTQSSPTAMPTTAPETAVPTPAPQATAPPSGEALAGPEYAPAFTAYWQPPTEFYGQPVYGGTLRINTHDTLSNGNIWGSNEAARNRLPTANQLVQRNPYNTDGPLIPDLAYGWSIHEDNQGVTFYFPDGITWHNGAAFTCEDARFSFYTMATGEGMTSSLFTTLFSHFAADSPRCVDDNTLEFRFKQPTAIPLEALSDRYAVIFNKQWFEEGGEDAMFLDLSVGTGPFMWKEGQSLGEADRQEFEKNPNYFHEGLPYVDELILFSIVDESAQQAAMLSHQTDWHWVRNFGQYNAYLDHPQIMTVIRPTNGAVEFVMNKRNEPFDNIRVRQAIAMGIDRDAAIQILQQGHGSKGFLFPPGGVWELDQEQGCAIPGWCQPADMAAQREETRQILTEEGFDFGKTYIITVESDRQKIDHATFLQEQLRLLGINTELNVVESVAFHQQGVDGTWADIRAHDGIDSSETGLAMGRNFRCNSVDNYWSPGTPCDQKMESLLDQLDAAVDQDARKRASDAVQLYAMQQYWKVNIFWEQEAAAFWPEVRGYSHFVRSVESYNRFSHMWVDPAHKDDTGFTGPTPGVPGGIQ